MPAGTGHLADTACIATATAQHLNHVSAGQILVITMRIALPHRCRCV
jgi:hypothetical protein